MTSYKLVFHKDAKKFMKQHKEIGLKFFKAFTELAEDKNNFANYQIKKVEGMKVKNVFRLRIGDYRAIFRVIDEEIIIFVFTINNRGDIYKEIKNIKKKNDE